uniref:Uncharacterized protein n=1 Tax=Populus trichocarpa TaxID=3694 RepID=A0A3N7HAH3_POPTR
MLCFYPKGVWRKNELLYCKSKLPLVTTQMTLHPRYSLGEKMPSVAVGKELPAAIPLQDESSKSIFTSQEIGQWKICT